MTITPVNIQIQRGDLPFDISIEAGKALFLLGANGTGKSALLHRINAGSMLPTRRISANRQNWLNSSAIEFISSQKLQFEQQSSNWDRHPESRFKEQNSRTALTIFELVDAENTAARAIASAMREDNEKHARELAGRKSPIATINQLFATSNLPVLINVEAGDRITASKAGSAPFGIAELSDGERNALLIAANVLTAKAETLLIIDEPERHLHRSIISPLISQLIEIRSDCFFVIATHDIQLPIDNPDSQVLLLRGCVFNGQSASSWEFDLLPGDVEIDETLKSDILGSRRLMIFVEGVGASLDRPLYTLLFPNASIVPKQSSRDVERAVRGLRSTDSTHWVQAYGIIDGDARPKEQAAALAADGLFVLPFYSVESIYYHPRFVKAVSKRLKGTEGEVYAEQCLRDAVRSVSTHVDRLASRASEKIVRQMIESHRPTFDAVASLAPINVSVDVAAVVREEADALRACIEKQDWLGIAKRYPVRETPALSMISRGIGFANSRSYESAVLQMLKDDADELGFARSLFESLDLPKSA